MTVAQETQVFIEENFIICDLSMMLFSSLFSSDIKESDDGIISFQTESEAIQVTIEPGQALHLSAIQYVIMLPCDGIMERNFGDAVSDYFFVPGTYTIFGYDEGIRGRVVNSPPSMLAELQELFAIPLRPSVVQRSNSLIVTEDGFMHHIGARIIDDKIHVRLYGA